MIPECRDCHRKRMDGVWQDLPDIQAAVMAQCAECGARELERQRREYRAAVLRTARRQAHLEPWGEDTPTVADVFQGMREVEK